jgi:glycosidase
VLRFIENNDTGDRFVTAHGPAMTELAATVEFTVPGMPLLYTGQEVGAEYDPYSLAEPVATKDPHSLRPVYDRLISLRRELPALEGRHIRLVGEGPDSTLAYLRPAVTGGSAALVAVNFSRRARAIPIDPASTASLMGVPLRDALTGEPVPAMDPSHPALAVPPRSALVAVAAG